MKASELIKLLQERIEERGDHETYYQHDGRIVHIEEVLFTVPLRKFENSEEWEIFFILT
jgi:hypothetical protein